MHSLNVTFQKCDAQCMSSSPMNNAENNFLSMVFPTLSPETHQNNTISFITTTSVTQMLPLELRTAATIVCVFVMTFGISGNLLVPFVVCRTKELYNSTNLFLINLSIADLLVIIVCMPIVLFELHSQPEVWTLGEAMCKAVPFVELVAAHGSILTILAISFERYYAICKPLKAGYKCTQMRALIIIILVWMVAVLATSPVLVIAELSESTYIDGSVVTVCLTQANTFWQKVYFLASMTAFFWAPLCVLLVVYSVITKRLVFDDHMITCNSEQAQSRARRQVVFMLAAVVICFFICLLPFRLLTLWLIFASEDQIKDLSMEVFYNILYFCRIMLYVNSMLNPCLYAVVSSKFREAFVRVLCCKQRNRQLIRRSTFNTTNSSVVMGSLKNSSVVMGSLKNSLRKAVRSHDSPSQSLSGHTKSPLFDVKFCDKMENKLNSFQDLENDIHINQNQPKFIETLTNDESFV